MLRYLSLLALAAVLWGSTLVRAKDDPPKPKSQLSPEASLEKLKAGHARFLANQVTPLTVNAKVRAQLAKAQNPFATVLTCADSRVPPEFVFDQGLGDLFVIRVAGNVTGTSILGSVEYAVVNLKVPLVVVLGHESCGAIKAALEEADPDGNLGFLLREVHVGKNLPANKKEAFAEATRTNVRFHAAEMTKRSSILKDFVQSGRLRIVGGVFSLTTGQIEWLPEAEKKKD